MQDVSELYESIGSDQPFYDLVERFYEGVESDPPLRALYPESLTAGKQRLAWFLIQRFGGAELFNQRRGDPRMRMRHAEFAITSDQAKRWVGHMSDAVLSVPAFAVHHADLMHFFEHFALFLVNTHRPTEVNLAL